MRRNILPITLLLAGVMLLASCLGDDDDSGNITYYGDSAITSFSLGTLNRTYLYNNGDTIKKTYEQDVDSTTTVDASTYTLTIDQLKGEIYNVDSLPAGTDISKVVCSVASKNSGVVVIKRLTSDTLDYYTSSDSLDFRQPREFRVYSTDGTGYRKYTVELRVHKELPDSFTWSRQTIMDITSFGAKGVKTVQMGDKMYSLVAGVNTVILSKDINGNSPWKQLGSNLNRVFSDEAYRNVAVLDGWMYLLDGGQLLKSQDGQNWSQIDVQNISNLKRLVGASSRKLYALTSAGIASSADGENWTEASMDGNTAMLPTGSISLCVLPSKTNKDVERVLMIGNSANADTAAVVWGKIEDAGETVDSYSWSLYEGTEKKRLPDMQGLSVMRYDGKLFAIGGAGMNGSNASPFDGIYCSTDQGLTWNLCTSLSLPTDFSRDASPLAVSMAADSYNNVWLVDAAQAQVWKMRVNRLGWKEEQRAFNE